MQQLHLVGFTTESDHLILSAKKGAKSGSFVVPLDERLLEVIADAVRRRNAEAGSEELTTPPELQPPPESPKRTSLLSPREIQARLRAGRTLGQVAREAVTDEEWVAKFAPPVLAERERVISRARDLVFTKPRRGESAEPLGLSVRWNLADRGVRLIDDEFDACWSAFHIGDTLWGITFEFVSRSRKQRAEWEVDLTDDVLLARNRVASDLGFVEPGRRRRLTLTPDPPEESKRRRAPGAQGAGETPTDHAGEPNRRRSTARRASPSKRAAKASRPRATSKAAKATKSAASRASKSTTRPATRAAKVSASATKARSTKKAAKATRTTKTVKATKTAKPTKTVKTAKSAKARKAGRAAGSSKRASRPRGNGDAARVASPSPSAAPLIAPVEPARRVPVKKLSELERRKLEMVRGTAPTPARRPTPRQLPPRPAPEPTRQPDEARRVEAQSAPSAPPAPTANPTANPTPTVDDGAAMAAAEEAARLRREERRRARAERLALAQSESPRMLPSAQLPDRSVIPSDDGRVATIRANRAGGASDVIVPGGPRPLRPAKAAAQPKRRRLTRSR